MRTKRKSLLNALIATKTLKIALVAMMTGLWRNNKMPYNYEKIEYKLTPKPKEV